MRLLVSIMLFFLVTGINTDSFAQNFDQSQYKALEYRLLGLLEAEEVPL